MVPHDLVVDGYDVPRYVRQGALRDVTLETNALTLVNNGNGFGYQVVNPATRGAVDVILGRRTVGSLLYFIASHPAHYRAKYELPTLRELTDLTGKSSAFREAMQELEQDGLLKPGQGQYNPFVITRTFTDAELAKLIHSKTYDQDRYLENFLMNTHNTLRQTRWNSGSDIQPMFGFPDAMKAGSRGPKTSMIIDDMEHTAIPLIFADHDHAPLKSWLNRNVDYDRLKTNLERIVNNPQIMASAVRYDVRTWQLPTLFEDQVKVKPSFWLQENGNHYTLEMGLTETNNGHTFTPLHRLTGQRVVCPEPSQALIESPGGPQFNLKRYGRYYLNLLRSIYPLPQLKDLMEQPSVQLSRDEARTFATLKEPLEHLGYQMAV